jgi:Ala-tRNA(Pro) deacylase
MPTNVTDLADVTPADSPASTYSRIMSLLDGHGVQYRVIDHEPQGRTHLASVVRGHPLAQAAKCMVVEVQVHHYVLCVVPGDVRVDLDAVRRLYGGTNARLAQRETAERLTGCERGTIAPFSFRPDALDLIADPRLLEHEKLYFNAARLDRSVAISAEDFLYVARPRLASVTEK